MELKSYERIVEVWYKSGRKENFIVDKEDVATIADAIEDDMKWFFVETDRVFVNLSNVESINIYKPENANE